MKVEWRILDGVEVQAFLPAPRADDLDQVALHDEKPQADKAILFCPGFPGAGASIFEQRHAGALAEKGFAVFVIHHQGTKLTGGFAPFMVNNAARLQKAYENGETHLGGKRADIAAWMVEPLKVLENIARDYSDIRVIGNSYGAVAALWSLTEEGAPVEKVTSLLLYAGAQATYEGRQEDSVLRFWNEEATGFAHVVQKVEFDAQKPFSSVLREVYKSLPERVKARLPATIGLTYLVVEGDEIIPLSDTENFKAAIGGRGNIVIDTIDHAWPEAGLKAHDTPNFKTKDLLELI